MINLSKLTVTLSKLGEGGNLDSQVFIISVIVCLVVWLGWLLQHFSNCVFLSTQNISKIWIPELERVRKWESSDFRCLVFRRSLNTSTLYLQPFRATQKGWKYKLYIKTANIVLHSGILDSKNSNNELNLIAYFYLFGIQMVANWMVQTIWLVIVTMVKSLVIKCRLVTELFTIWIVNY